MGKLTSTPDFVNDEGHQAHSYPDLLVNLGVVGLHGYPNIFYEALQHLKGKAVNSHTALALGFAGKTRPCPVKVHPPSHTTPQGAPLVPAPLPIATTAPQPWPPQPLSFLTAQSSPSMCGVMEWSVPSQVATLH